MLGKNLLRSTLVASGAALVAFLLPVTAASAADTLFWIDLESEQVMSMQLNGSSTPAALSTAPAAVVADQQSDGAGSLDYDPETGRLYWPNAGVPGNISWAAADGSGGGQLNVTTNPVQPTNGLSLDGANDLLYLVGGTGESVATMGLDGTQGTWALNDDNFRGGPLVDAQGGTLWLAGPEWVSHGNLDGSRFPQTLTRLPPSWTGASRSTVTQTVSTEPGTSATLRIADDLVDGDRRRVLTARWSRPGSTYS